MFSKQQILIKSRLFRVFDQSSAQLLRLRYRKFHWMDGNLEIPRDRNSDLFSPDLNLSSALTLRLPVDLWFRPGFLLIPKAKPKLNRSKTFVIWLVC
jgi:hypothetical protein